VIILLFRLIEVTALFAIQVMNVIASNYQAVEGINHETI
jgi:hypothetical protein